MASKPLIKTNPYLKDPEKRRALFIRTVLSSTAIEGVHVAADDLLKAPQTTAKSIAVFKSEGPAE